MFDWDRAFVNTNFSEKVLILNKTISNILSNFIPHETLTIGDKDPPWLKKKIKKLSKRKTTFVKAIKTVKTTTIHITWGDSKFYKKTYITQLKFPIYYSRITYELPHLKKI